MAAGMTVYLRLGGPKIELSAERGDSVAHKDDTRANQEPRKRLPAILVGVVLPAFLALYVVGYFLVPHRLGALAGPDSLYRAEQAGITISTVDFDYRWQAILWRPAVFLENTVRRKTFVRSTTGLLRKI